MNKDKAWQERINAITHDRNQPNWAQDNLP